MVKTTVYLTQAQKQALQRLARETGRSQANLIREGVDLVTGLHRTSDLVLPLFSSGRSDLAEKVDSALRGFGEV
jgi:Ribbon-helix-helix domain